MSIFETLGQKLEVLLSIFCGTKINLEWITPPPPFLDLATPPPICLTQPLILNFVQPPPPLIIQNSEDSITPTCNWGVQTMMVKVGLTMLID